MTITIENVRSARQRGRESYIKWRRGFEERFYAPDAELQLAQALSQLPPEIVSEAAKQAPEIKEFVRGE